VGQKFLGIQSHFQDIIEQGKEWRQRKSGHEYGHKPVLQDHLQVLGKQTAGTPIQQLEIPHPAFVLRLVWIRGVVKQSRQANLNGQNLAPEHGQINLQNSVEGLLAHHYNGQLDAQLCQTAA